MTCDACGTAPQGATTCPTTCADGEEGDPKSAFGCTPCAAGKYRSGDMPACITVSNRGPQAERRAKGAAGAAARTAEHEAPTCFLATS
jgi:hypothetical protein